MLEIKPRSTDRTARAALSSRASSRQAAYALPSRPPAWESPERARREARRGIEQARNRRLARSEARLLTTAISFTAVVCGLLVIYLAAYARVTLLGIDQAQARTALHQKSLQNEMLKAQVAELESPARISALAEKMGLTRDARRTDYIKPAPAVVPTQTASAVGVGAVTDAGSVAASEGTNSGPTPDGNTTTRHD